MLAGRRLWRSSEVVVVAVAATTTSSSACTPVTAARAGILSSSVSVSVSVPSVRHYAGGAPFQHVDTPYNNASTPFDFTVENYEKVKEIIARYPPQYARAAVIPLLDLAQRQYGWLPLAAMNKVAKILDMHPIRVYEVATFYTMFQRAPVGKHHLEVCTTTPCMLRGAYDIVKTCEEVLGIKVGEMTKDGKFSLAEVECLGACVNAPMLQIGDWFYEDLDKETTTKLINDLKAGKAVEQGPQHRRRKGCEPEGQPTSLIGEPMGPHCTTV